MGVLLLAFGLVLTIASCRVSVPPSGGNSEATALADPVVVGKSAQPVGLHRSWATGLVTLDAAIIGKNRHRQRAELVVDTGAEISGILETVAFGLPDGRERVEVRTLHGGNLDGGTVKGGVFPWPVAPEPGILDSIADTSFVVFPSSANLPDKADGLLGADFLLSERIAVDLGGRRLLPSPAAVPAPRNSWVRLDLLTAAAADSPLRFLKMNVGRQTLIWLVDSGAERSLLMHEAGNRLEIRVSRSGPDAQQVDAGGGRVSLGRAKLKNVTWGAYRIPSLVVGVAPMDNLRRLRVSGGGSVDGVLGLDFLERHSAIIDLAARALWVRLP